jgi:hypothetical protein
MIRYCVLYKKSNTAIQTKFSLVYGRDALGQRTMDTWAAHFRSGRTSVEDDERRGRLSSDNLSDAVSDYLNRNPHASCREVVEDLFIPMAAILRVLDEMSLRFFVARWVPYKRSFEVKVKRIEICQEMLDVLEQFGPRQKIILLQGMNAGFTGIIITEDNGQQIVLEHHLEFVLQFHRKYDDFSLFHPPMIYFR